MAAIPAARSLLHPYAEEPLPLYTPRHPTATDPETSSINSSAPSYTSAAPSYHSNVPPSHRRSNDFSSSSSSNGNQNAGGAPRLAAPSSQQGLLPSEGYAPGFRGYVRDSSHHSSSGSSSSSNNLSQVHSLYNISEWVPVTEGLQARHYHNVAKRRVTAASSSTGAANPLFAFPVPTISEPPVCGMGSSSRYGHGGGAGTSDVISPASQMRSSPSPVNSGFGRGSVQANVNNSSTVTLGIDLREEESASRARTGQNNNEEEAAQNDVLAEAELPVSPHEDPDLVGEAAAARFRSQRLYMTAQHQQNQSLAATASCGAPYSSLLDPQTARPIPTHSQSTDQLHRPSSSPNPLTATHPRATTATFTHERHHSVTTAAEDEALRAQESKTWDFMLAQMADWEERERSWKRFKEEADRRVGAGVLRGQGLRLGLGRGFGSGLGGGGGKGKLRKTQSGDPTGGSGRPKWMSKVGFTR